MIETATNPRWLLALESSTPNGGAALLENGNIAEIARLAEGLRHGRELMPAAATLLHKRGLRAADLWAVAVSIGPGSYTGLRVGVMAAKALAFGSGCLLAGVSSLAALAASLPLEQAAGEGDTVFVMQDARRDEVYAGIYRIEDGTATAIGHDAAITPEEAAARYGELLATGVEPIPAGSGFTTYADLFRTTIPVVPAPAPVNPAAVARLAWRQLLREETADPLLLQPIYLRRDAGSDWRHDHLIGQS